MARDIDLQLFRTDTRCTKYSRKKFKRKPTLVGLYATFHVSLHLYMS